MLSAISVGQSPTLGLRLEARGNKPRNRESPASKELKRVSLDILPNSAFGCPAYDLYGCSYAEYYWHLAGAIPDKSYSDLFHRKPAIEVPFGNRDSRPDPNEAIA
jgi:hypothetical protein